jgi:hypothetical protein
LVSLVNVTCFFRLQQLQPLFAGIALGALGYQAVLIRRQAPSQRSFSIKTLFWGSLGVNIVVFGGWIALWIRYL